MNPLPPSLDLRRRRLLLGGAGLLVAACSRSPEPSSAGRLPVSAGVQRIGHTDIPSSLHLTARTRVIDNPARVVQQVSADGTRLLLDAGDPVVRRLSVGDTLLLRDQVVLKVASLEARAGGVAVTVTAPALTDLIEDGEIVFADTDIDLGGATTRALAGIGNMPSRRWLFDSLINSAWADEPSKRLKGKLKDYDFDIGYSLADTLVNFDGSVHGEPDGITVDASVSGHVKRFAVGGRAAVQSGRAVNLNMLVSKLDGEVNFSGSAKRGSKGGNPGQALLELPYEMEVPLVIDGIPFRVTLKAALLLNAALSNVDASAELKGHVSFNGSQGLAWMPDPTGGGEPRPPPPPKAQGNLSADFSLKRGDGIGLGPQAYLISAQFPRLGLALGWGLASAGAFIDVVTTETLVLAGALALVPCNRGEIIVSGSVGIEAKFLMWEHTQKTEAFHRNYVRTVPDIKACQV